MALNFRQEQLKKDILHVLRQHPEGVDKDSILGLVNKHTGRHIKPKEYGCKKFSDIFIDWKDVEMKKKFTRIYLFARQDSSEFVAGPSSVGYTQDFPLAFSAGPSSGGGGAQSLFSGSTWGAPALTNPTWSQINKSSRVEQRAAGSDEEQDSDTDVMELPHLPDRSTPNKNMEALFKPILTCLCGNGAFPDIVRSNLKEICIKNVSHLPTKAQIKAFNMAVNRLRSADLIRNPIRKHLGWTESAKAKYMSGVTIDELISEMDDNGPVPLMETRREPARTAMDLMKQAGSRGPPIKSEGSVGRQGDVVITIDDDTEAVIDLTEDRRQDTQPPPPLQPLNRTLLPTPRPQPLMNIMWYNPMQPMQLGGGNTSHQPAPVNINNNPFLTGRVGLQGNIDVSVKPVTRVEFERRDLVVHPVYIPPGRPPTREFVNNIAKECVDTLAEANEYVNPDRIQKLVCQRMGIRSLTQLGFYNMDQIPSIREHNMLISKINAYILAFVKTRSICTLHELKECLTDYAANKDDFANLKVGPIQRLPEVYRYFNFPPDQAEIPEITSMDILDHFHNFLSVNKLWSRDLTTQLEPFIDYLVEQYQAENAYLLGVNIRSVKLASGVSY